MTQDPEDILAQEAVEGRETALWRVVPSFPDYEVSDDGRVRRVTSARTRRAGHVVRGALRGRPHSRYWSYKLVSPNGRKCTVWAHRIVLEAFVGPPPSATHQAAHGDGNPLNNRLENLRWATPTENNRDKTRHGTNPFHGTKNPRAKLNEDLVRTIRFEYATTGCSKAALARKHGLGPSAMGALLAGKNWSHVGS